MQQLCLVEMQQAEGPAPVHMVKEVAENEDEVDGAGMKETLAQAVQQLAGAAVIIQQGPTRMWVSMTERMAKARKSWKGRSYFFCVIPYPGYAGSATMKKLPLRNEA